MSAGNLCIQVEECPELLSELRTHGVETHPNVRFLFFRKDLRIIFTKPEADAHKYCGPYIDFS